MDEDKDRIRAERNLARVRIDELNNIIRDLKDELMQREQTESIREKELKTLNFDFFIVEQRDRAWAENDELKTIIRNMRIRYEKG